MGMFSWIDPKTGRNIVAMPHKGYTQTAYVSIPKEFGGGCLVESSYNGYGVFDGMDIYELVADWNREYMPKETRCLEKPKPEQYSEETFKYACDRYEKDMSMLRDWGSMEYDEVYMAKTYGKNFKRNIGIIIACYDEDNSKLEYPIKIAESPLVYEFAEYSPSDPDQGFYPNWMNDDSCDNWDDWDEDEW